MMLFPWSFASMANAPFALPSPVLCKHLHAISPSLYAHCCSELLKKLINSIKNLYWYFLHPTSAKILNTALHSFCSSLFNFLLESITSVSDAYLVVFLNLHIPSFLLQWTSVKFCFLALEPSIHLYCWGFPHCGRQTSKIASRIPGRCCTHTFSQLFRHSHLNSQLFKHQFQI